MLEASGTVHEHEIAVQVSAMAGQLDPVVHLDTTAVKKHMQEHMLDQRVVLVNVLRDLLNVAKAAKRMALCEGVVESGEPHRSVAVEDDSMSIPDSDHGKQGPTGPPHHVLDTKAMAVYLKTVDQITCIYKLPSMARLHTTGAK
jgi:hypothetical protein